LNDIIDKSKKDGNYNFWDDLPNTDFYVSGPTEELTGDTSNAFNGFSDSISEFSNLTPSHRVESEDKQNLIRTYVEDSGETTYISHESDSTSYILYVASYTNNAGTYHIVYATYYDRTETKMTEYLCIDDTVYDSSTT